jgi:uncharacterized protein YndB with AHSA1/START domain
MSGKTETIQQVEFVPAPPRQVYEAFLDAAKHSAFTGAEATVDPVVGGKFTAHGGFISGEILELEDGERIVQSWRTSQWPKGAPPSRLDLTFRPKDGGTEITMVHSEVPASQAKMYRKGWVDNYWKPLRKYFGG